MRHLALLALPMMVVACNSKTETPATAEPAATSTPAAAAPASHEAHPRVFFVEPKDGATVKSPVALAFGIENYELAAVPAGEVKEARPHMGHHHVGVEQGCLPGGTNIVKGTPSWMHFGKAETSMSLQLTPGQHKLSLQLADDLHNAIEGMCQTVTINVVE